MADRKGFDDFVTGRSTHLLRVAYLVTGDRARAEEVVGEALVAVWAAWPTLDTDPESRARGEVLARVTPTRSLRGRLAGALRSRSAPAAPEPAPVGGGVAVRHDPDRADPDRDLWQRFQALDPRLRVDAVLRWFERLPGVDSGPALDALRVEGSELAALLEERSDDVGAGPEAGAVREVARGRRRLRTRRVAALAVVATVAVAVAVTPSVIAGDEEAPPPPPKVLAGHEIPPELTAQGFGFEYTEGHESEANERDLRVRLPGSDEPRLVVWGSTAPRIAAFVTASIDGRWRGRTPAGVLKGYEYLGPGAHEVVLTQSGVGLTERLAVAVYTPSPDPPPGVGDGRTTFRADVLGERLLSAVVGAPGAADAEVAVDVPGDRVRVAFTCYGTGQHLVEVTVAGRQVGGGHCSEGPPRDPGAVSGPWSAGVVGGLPAGRTTLSARLVDADGEPVTDENAVVGAALYTDLVPTERVGGVDVPTLVELEGHTWVLHGVPITNPRGWSEQRLAAGPGTPARMYVALVRGGGGVVGPLTWDVRVDDKVVDTLTDESGRGGATFSPYLVVPAGGQRMLEVAVTRGSGLRTQVGFVTYRLDDEDLLSRG